MSALGWGWEWEYLGSGWGIWRERLLGNITRTGEFGVECGNLMQWKLPGNYEDNPRTEL